MSRAVRYASSGCSSLRKIVPVLVVMMGVLLLVAPMFGQTANGRITGTVKDQTGGAIVGAAVTVTDVARGLARNLTTDEAGAYLATNLLPGNYTVRSTFTGFQAWERTNIAVGVGGEVFIDVTLVPGAQTQTVTITEELPMVNTTSSTLGGALSNEVINDLPVSGRSFINIMDLRPGVTLTLGNDSGGAGAASVNGLRPEQSNEYLVEGLHAMDAYTGQSVMNNFALNGDATGILSTDAIQDFNQQFGSKAEFGYRPGGSTNIGLKSGTNAIHATGFAFFRKTELDARNYFNGPLTGQPQVNNSLEQFGGTVGGPIKRDKLFFFLSYEQQNSGHGSASSNNVGFTDPSMISNFPNCATNGPAISIPGGYNGPSSTCTPLVGAVNGGRNFTNEQHFILACLAVRDQQGTVPTGSPAGRSVLLSPQSLSLIGLNSNCLPGSTYPNATNGATWFLEHGGNDHGAPADPAFNVQQIWPNLQTENRQISGVAKIDYTINEKNTLNGFLFTGRGNNIDQGAVFPIFRTNITVKPLVVAGTWTFLPNSAWANSFRMGFARSDQIFLPRDEEAGLTQSDIGLPTGVRVYGERNLGYPQSTALNGYNSVGARNTEVQGPEDSLEIQEQVSYLSGNHSVRFGGSLMTSNQNGATWANTRGTFAFGSAASGGNVANGIVAFLAGQNPVPTTIPGTSIVLNTQTGSNRNTGLQTSSLFYGDPSSHVRRKTYSLFAQDDWRIHPRVTLNLGLRYDLTTVPFDRDQIMGSFDPNLGLVQEGNQIDRVHNGDHNNVAPRVGFAWDMFGTGTTVLKAGAGITYELVTLRHYVELGNAAGPTGTATAWIIGCTGTLATGSTPIPAGATSNCSGNLFTSGGTRNVGQASWSASDSNILPSVSWDTAAGGTIFPSSALNNCSTAVRIADKVSTSSQAGRAGGRCGVVFLDRNMPTPLVQNWNVSITHAIARNLVLDVAYVGNHGVKLIGRVNDNQAVPFLMWNQPATSTPGGPNYAALCVANPTTNNCNGGNNGNFNTIVSAGGTAQPYSAKFPHLSNLTRIFGRDTSNYNGLQITLTARNFHGLNVTTGYTWSHALAITSGNGSNIGTDSYINGYDYGPAGSDLRHKITISPSYNLPAVTGYWGLLEGWKVNGIFRWQSGPPFGPGNGGDWLGDGRSVRWNFFGDRKDFEFWSPDDAHATFHPGGPATGSANCNQSSNAANSCVGTPNANTDLQGRPLFTSLGGQNLGQSSQTACSALPAGACYTAADLAINTAACTSHVSTSTHTAVLRANGCWTRGNSVLLPPDLNTLGNIPRAFFQAQPYWNLDTSITKRQRITERLNTEFRFEFFNILNHPNFGNKSAGLGCSVTACTMGFRSNSVAGGNNILGSGQPRRVQLGVKILF